MKVKKKYKIVLDKDFGLYKAYFRSTWWPFWSECYNYNSSGTLEAAMKIVNYHKQGLGKYGRKEDSIVYEG